MTQQPFLNDHVAADRLRRKAADMKLAAIIGASAESVHTIQAARELGICVTALDGNPQAEGLRAADNGEVVDISKEEETIDKLREIGPDFLLVAPIGRYLTTIGAANDALGLRGISGEAARLCTDKWAFHEKLSAAGLRSCSCSLLSARFWEKRSDQTAQIGALFAKLQGMHYPAIIKPRYGSGSRDISIVQSYQEMQKKISSISFHAKEDFVVEELVDGQEYGVDGAVVGDTFQLILLRKKLVTPLPARQAVGYYSVLPGEMTEQMQDYLQKVISLLGLRDCLLHADLICAETQEQAAGNPFIIELSARPSGHYLHDLFTPLATGVDMAAEMVRYQIGEPYRFLPDSVTPMLIRYFDFTGKAAGKIPTAERAREVLTEHELPVSLLRYECHIHPHEKLAPPNTGHVLMERGFFILKALQKDIGRQEAEYLLERGAERILEAFQVTK